MTITKFKKFITEQVDESKIMQNSVRSIGLDAIKARGNGYRKVTD